MSQPDTVPFSVRRAMLLVYGPNVELESYVRCRGIERGAYEYEKDRPERGQQIRQAHDLLVQAREISDENGWDWESVKEVARREMGLTDEWRTPDDQRLVDAERARAVEMRAEQERRWQQHEQDMAEIQARLDRERAERAESERAEAERDQQRRTEQVRAEQARGEQYVSELADRIRTLPETTKQTIRKAKTMKARRSIVNDLMIFVLDTRNETATRRAVDQALGTSAYVADTVARQGA